LIEVSRFIIAWGAQSSCTETSGVHATTQQRREKAQKELRCFSLGIVYTIQSMMTLHSGQMSNTHLIPRVYIEEMYRNSIYNIRL
jgi:hypothetical protein